MNRPGLILGVDRIADQVALARSAEAAGFGSVWTTEFHNRNGLVRLAAVAGATSRVKVGTGIAYAHMRAPALNAAAAMDVDEISGGRMILGLGSGTRSMNEQWYGVPFEPRSAPKMKECAALIRQHFATANGGTLRFDGEFYRIRIPAFTRPHAVRASIPIYFAAVQPAMLRAAGEVADGLFGHMIFTRRYLREVVWPHLGIGLARAKRSRTDFDLAGNLIVSVSDDRARALAEAKAQIAFYATAKSYEGIFALSGWQAEKRAIDEAFRSFDYRKMGECVSDEMVEEIAIAGTPAECREKLARWEGVIDTPVFYAPVVGVTPDRVLENSRRIVETFAQ